MYKKKYINFNKNTDINDIDIYYKMLNERTLFLIGDINDDISNTIIMQLFFLESKNNNNIYLYINSVGGNISSGMSIYDFTKYIKSNILVICLGCAYSMAAFILSSGNYGYRYSLINSRIMFHQPIGGTYGQASDILIHTKEILYLKNKINFLLSYNLKKNFNFIKKIINRDNFMSPIKALFLNIIDYILINK